MDGQDTELFTFAKTLVRLQAEELERWRLPEIQPGHDTNETDRD